MKFLRRSLVSSIAGAAAAWTWRNRSKLTNRADRPGRNPKSGDHRADRVANEAVAGRHSTGTNRPSDVSVPVS